MGAPEYILSLPLPRGEAALAQCFLLVQEAENPGAKRPDCWVVGAPFQWEIKERALGSYMEKRLFLFGNCSLCVLLREHLGCYIEQSFTIKVDSVDSLKCF